MAFLLHLQPSLKFPNSSHLIPTRPSSSRLSSPTNSSTQINSIDFSKWVTGFRSKSLNFALSTTLSLALSLTDFGLWKWVLHCLGKLMMSISNLYSIRQCLWGSYTGVGFAEGKVGVNKPELLPEDFSTVIDVAGFLSDGQEKRISQEIADIEKDTGFKLRVLAQNYPDTPGLAIKDYWQVDDRTIIFVADPTFGNIINFNVGASVDLDIPRSFWSRLAGKYGNKFYWKEKGEDASIEAAVMAISNCLREPVGRNNCSEVSPTL